MAKTDLEKSHSKLSNFKLTLICYILAHGIAILWIGLALLKFDKIDEIIRYVILAVGGIFTLLGIILVNAFSRE